MADRAVVGRKPRLAREQPRGLGVAGISEAEQRAPGPSRLGERVVQDHERREADAATDEQWPKVGPRQREAGSERANDPETLTALERGEALGARTDRIDEEG